MGTNNTVFLEILEWFDETGQELVHRLPEEGSGEIKFGAQLIVRGSQAAVFFYKGKSYEAFGPGRHTLTTANIPVLTKILSAPWALTSPLRAEVYFVNMKVFTNLKWGTRDPVAFKDGELGLVRIRAHGVFNIQVVQPLLFINTLVGTRGFYITGDIEEYLRRVIVSRFNDYLGEHLDSLVNLPGRYDEISRGLQERLHDDFAHYGLLLENLYIGSVTPPPDVQQAIDDKSRLGVLGDLDRFVKMKAAMAMEKAASSQNSEAGQGIGLGFGFMMPALFADAIKRGEGESGPATPPCPDCGKTVSRDARFCPFCGHQQLVFDQCSQCGKNLPPRALFCPRCGHATGEKPPVPVCRHCKKDNLDGSVFCNHCGERL
ncbi:MAG: SPFH domain-containing protein [Deltaproteobacteria bacterium]|nr:SPFH domain-containing protein [Deltaproteobacteria bacterium]